MSRKAKGRILVVRGGAIGDFILTLPVFAALRDRFNDCHIEVLGYPHIARLAEAGGYVDAVRPIEGRPLAAFFARGGPLPPEYVAYFGGFDLILSYLYDPDGIFQENVLKDNRAQFIQGIHRPEESERVPASKVFLRALERLAIFDSDPVPRLNLADASKVRQLKLAVHPGSGSEQKNWPEAKWAVLLKECLHETDARFLLIGGEAEEGRAGRLARRLDSSRVELAENVELVTLAGVLSGCCGFVGHDSGITHLAAAVGVPTLALWGATNDTLWAPRGPAVNLLHAAGGLEGLSVHEVFGALLRDRLVTHGG